MKLTALLIGCIFLSSLSLFPQDDGIKPCIIDTITSKINVLEGYSCLTEAIVNFDKIKKPLNANNGGFEDPYNTLRHSFIFTYYKDSVKINEGYPKLSIGIYRDKTIVGRLDTIIETNNSTSGRIKTITDLNMDGEVDIVITRTLGVSPPPWEEYWIFSWNGKCLRLISEVDHKSRHSTLQSPWNYLKFIDIDTDGIYELVTSFKDEKGIRRKHVYSWNGELYGDWGKGSKALLKSSSKKKNE